MGIKVNFKGILFSILVLSIFPSCILFPLPSDHGDEIEKVQKKIKIGSTKREEIISILGKPDVSKDRYILYLRKNTYGGVFFWGVGLFGVSSQTGVGKEFMDLYFEFDNFGVLVELRTDKYDLLGNSIEQR
jgi:hypothetical protein